MNFREWLRLLGVFACLSAVTNTYAANGTAPTFSAPKEAPYREGYLLVKHRRDMKASQLATLHGMIGVKQMTVKSFKTPVGLELIKLKSGIDVESAVKEYKKDPNILYAEPDYILHATEVVPNDTRFSEQWPLNNVGQDGGVADVDLNMPDAWGLELGDSETYLAIIDTGINYKHPDLQKNAGVNPGEIPGNNIDDDGNGIVDDVHGLNAVKNNGDPLDDNGHGSHVMGIMGASGDDGIGVTGILQKASIISCKFLDAYGSGSTSDALKCLEYIYNLKTRAQNPMNIIATNNSWAGGPFSQAMYDAIQKQKQAGILFMAAASNEGDDNDQVGTYPANYDAPNIISVAAIDNKGQMASFSNYGAYSVHVSAPGVDILSTVTDDKYDVYSGTSMATPHVTGLAGLIHAYDPTLDWRGIKNLILAGGVPGEGKVANSTITGRFIRAFDVNGRGSLTCHDQIVSKILKPKAKSINVALGASIDFSVLSINCASANGPVTIGSDVQLQDDGQGKDATAGDGVFSGAWTATAPGDYDLELSTGDKVHVHVFDRSQWFTYKAKPAQYSYRKIEGVALNAGDDTVHEVAIPFPVHFAGDSAGFTTAYISSNGAISFTESVAASWLNVTLPVADHKTFIAPFWDDLNTKPSNAPEGADIYTQVVGEAPNREFVIEWRQISSFQGLGNVTFQVVFFENSSDVLFNYLDTKFNDRAAGNNGASATVGVQVDDQNYALYGYNQGIIKSRSSILWSKDDGSVSSILPEILPDQPSEEVSTFSVSSQESMKKGLVGLVVAQASSQGGGCSAIKGEGNAVNLIEIFALMIAFWFRQKRKN